MVKVSLNFNQQPISFKCRNGMSATLPNQTIFESDDSYLNKYYDQFLMLKFSRCPDETDKVRWFNIEISKKRQRYSMACTKSGRFMVEASYFDDIEKQSETPLISKVTVNQIRFNSSISHASHPENKPTSSNAERLNTL